MIGGRGRVEVDCVRFLLHQADTTGLSLSGRATFSAAAAAKMGQIDLRVGGAYDRPTRECLLLWRAYKVHGTDFGSVFTRQRPVGKPPASPALHLQPH